MKKLTRKGAWDCITDALCLIAFYPLITVALVTTHFSVFYFAPHGSVLMIEMMLCLIVFKLGFAFYKDGDLRNAPVYIKNNIYISLPFLGMLAAFAAILVGTGVLADAERGLASYHELGRFTTGFFLDALISTAIEQFFPIHILALRVLIANQFANSMRWTELVSTTPILFRALLPILCFCLVLVTARKITFDNLWVQAFTSVLFIFANYLTIIGYCHVYDVKKNERRKKRKEKATLLAHGAQ